MGLRNTETREDGQAGIWSALRLACESEESGTAENILKDVGIKIVNSLQICYDGLGNMYKLPIYVINYPISYAEIKIEEIKAPLDPKELKLKIRSMKDQSVNEITINEMKTIKNLKEQYKQLIKNESAKIRFFAKGKELYDDKSIYIYELTDGITILAQMSI